ncbi:MULTISPECIES: NAD(P)/FAD-dependent oxidoreductase [Thermoanaerobacter]|uniref:NAD(P)H-nitrite reductase n=2 Tax=Thermoanaerobacter thermohydrosulfuricus TaxID=1516 RepID=M8DU03_THETY|nr:MULTISPECIES: FAD-dependent oxidoreductase [Thermoanaerobacter]EMT39946.1 NAD(P)H-nitrite reductase [Thermoanaerobacter thermohydrosulfuricus WC1]UZQ83749.1 FAD-dependent oxidoreductase [Thermoanaerobacter sp. RKWS2]
MKYVLIGNGIAALSACENIRKNDKGGKITIISKEPYPTYYRLKLSQLLGKDLNFKSLLVKEENWYTDNDIELMLNTSVRKVDTKNKKLILSNDEIISYDRLIIATGSSSFIPNVLGREKKGVFAIRSLEDVKDLNEFIKDKKKGVVIGGGLLGLEAAWTLRQNGYEITVVEFFPRLLPRQADEEGSIILKDIIESNGINLLLGAEVTEITGQTVNGIILKDGTKMDADFVIFSSGVKPNIDIVKETEIKVNKGIIVDEYMRTNIEDVYAAGDVAEFNGKIYGLWTVAMAQGKNVGLNVSGNKTAYKEVAPSSTLKITGIDVFSAGDISGEENISKSYIGNNVYYKLYFKDGIIVGAILIGDIGKSTKLKNAIESKQDFSNILNKGFGAKDIIEAI